jgi:hypothetical protein
MAVNEPGKTAPRTDMFLLIHRFFLICLFRASPQDLPASSFLLLLSLAAYALIGFLMALNKSDAIQALAMVGVDLVLLAGLTWAILWVRLLGKRYPQTLTALAGCGAMLALFAWPLLLWQQYSDNSTLASFVAVLMWLWFFWQILVFSHIISQALSTSLYIGTGLALVYMFISYSVAQSLFFR